ncbi:PPCT protein, partial [Polypterus senegalus]
MRELKVNGRRIWVTLAKSVSIPQCLEKPPVIRVQDYKQSLAMESDGEAGTRGLGELATLDTKLAPVFGGQSTQRAPSFMYQHSLMQRQFRVSI